MRAFSLHEDNANIEYTPPFIVAELVDNGLTTYKNPVHISTMLNNTKQECTVCTHNMNVKRNMKNKKNMTLFSIKKINQINRTSTYKFINYGCVKTIRKKKLIMMNMNEVISI